MSDYLNRRKRSLAEVEAERIEPGDPARHVTHGECRVVDVLRPQGVARIEFPSGGGLWVDLAHLEKLAAPDQGGDPPAEPQR